MVRRINLDEKAEVHLSEAEANEVEQAEAPAKTLTERILALVDRKLKSTTTYLPAWKNRKAG